MASSPLDLHLKDCRLNETASVFCPAKVNLYLEVHDKRPDGYHNLGTLFQTLEIGDTLTATRSDRFSLLGAESVTPDPESNLILKAARRLVDTAIQKGHSAPKEKGGLQFNLKKSLPAGAGLGGGSTNAAGALRLTQQLLQLPVDESDLNAVAKSLGADIPFFLFGGAAFAEGIGEQLKPAPDPFPFHVVIATPNVHVSTAWAYQNLFPTRKNQWGQFKALYHLCNEDPHFYQALRNDFEAPMIQHYPEIAQLHAALSQFEPTKVMLSGSGASLFALFVKLDSAQKALNAIAPQCRFHALTGFSQS